ncbi:MAG TPA: hypothetical protein VJ725_16955 [Thermoanaerobaculia bacterium]|nr:hypothetical protein [Thermoanaerobaculia bacterium]
MRRPWRLVASGILLAVQALAAQAQQVTLPLDKYEELRARARPALPDSPVPPVPYALERAEVEVVAGATSARIAHDLSLTIYADGWQQVPLGEGFSFTKADLGTLEGRVEADEEEQEWVLIVRGRGTHRVRLESIAPVEADESAVRPTWRLRFPAPRAAVLRGSLTAAPEVDEVELSGPEGAVRRSPDGKGWAFAALPAGSVSFRLSGKTAAPQQDKLPLRFEATAATTASLSRTRLGVRGWVEARVAQGRLSRLAIAVPPGLEVTDARGLKVAGWKMEGSDLIITPVSPINDSLAVEMELIGEPKDTFASPLLIPRESSRTSLLVKAALRGDGLLNLVESGSAQTPDDREVKLLPENLQKVPGRVFKILDPTRPPLWEAVWAERSEVLAVQIDRLLVDVAVGQAGRASYQLWAEVRNRGSQQLVLNLPAGFELVDGRRDGIPVEAGTASQDGGALAVPLLTGDTPQVVHVQGVMPLALPKASGDLVVPLPELSAPAARVEVRVVLPGGRSYTLADPTRASGVSLPLASNVTRNVSNRMAQQVTSESSRPVSLAAWTLFDQPPGFARVEAGWSALSASPSPLVIRVQTGKEKVEWF